MAEQQDTDGTIIEGWLRKSHAGKEYNQDSRRRYFASTGFHIFYYSDESKGKTKGHFDLRNVVEIAPVAESVAPNAIRLCIAESKGAVSKVTKSMIVSIGTLSK